MQAVWWPRGKITVKVWRKALQVIPWVRKHTQTAQDHVIVCKSLINTPDFICLCGVVQLCTSSSRVSFHCWRRVLTLEWWVNHKRAHTHTQRMRDQQHPYLSLPDNSVIRWDAGAETTDREPAVSEGKIWRHYGVCTEQGTPIHLYHHHVFFKPSKASHTILELNKTWFRLMSQFMSLYDRGSDSKALHCVSTIFKGTFPSHNKIKIEQLVINWKKRLFIT